MNEPVVIGPSFTQVPRLITEDAIENAIDTLEDAGLLTVKRDDTGRVRWFTLATRDYASDELRKGLEHGEESSD